MRKTIIILSLIMFTFHSFAQEKTRVREAGISFKNLNKFGLLYRIGNNKSVWNFDIGFGRGKETANTTYTNQKGSAESKGSSISFSISKELRKNIVKKLEFRYGLGLNYSKEKGKNNQKNTYSNPNIQPLIITTNKTTTESLTDVFSSFIKLGFNYVSSNNVIVGVEMSPSISWITNTLKTISIIEDSNTTTESKRTTESSSVSFNLSTNSAVLSVAYRF